MIMTTLSMLGAGLIAAIVIGIVLLMMIFYAVGIFNQLVTLQQRFKNAYAQIDIQLQRRYDLIPNLVETAKGYMAHERGTLEAVIAARNTAYAASKAAASNPGDTAAMKS